MEDHAKSFSITLLFGKFYVGNENEYVYTRVGIQHDIFNSLHVTAKIIWLLASLSTS